MPFARTRVFLARYWQLLVLLLLGSGLILAGPSFPQYWQVSTIGFGQALVATAILGMTVDLLLKEKTVQDISRSTAHYIIGYQLPSEVQGRIGELLRTVLVRHDFTIRYRLEPEEGKMACRIEFGFALVNHSHAQIAYTQLLELETLDRPKIHELRCDSTDPKPQYCLHPDGKESKEAGVLEAKGKKIWVQPKDKQQNYSMAGKYTIVAPDEGSDIFAFAATTLNVIVYVESPVGYEVVVSPENDAIKNDGCWQFRKAFLRGEHVRVRWFRRERTAGL